METLQDVVNKLKINFAKKLEIDLLNENYGLKSCLKDPFNEFGSDKVEIIFLSNLCYLTLRENQMKKIIKRNYKNLLEKRSNRLNIDNVELVEPAVVNTTVVKNVQTIINNKTTVEENLWDQTDW